MHIPPTEACSPRVANPMPNRLTVVLRRSEAASFAGSTTSRPDLGSRGVRRCGEVRKGVGRCFAGSTTSRPDLGWLRCGNPHLSLRERLRNPVAKKVDTKESNTEPRQKYFEMSTPTRLKVS